MSFKFLATDVVILGEGAVADEVWLSIGTHAAQPRTLFAAGSPHVNDPIAVVDPRDLDAFTARMETFKPGRGRRRPRVFFAGRLPSQTVGGGSGAISESLRKELVPALIATGLYERAMSRVLAETCVRAGLTPTRICTVCCNGAHNNGWVAGPALSPPDEIQLAKDGVRIMKSDPHTRFAIQVGDDERGFPARLSTLPQKLEELRPPAGAVVLIMPNRLSEIFECSSIDAQTFEDCAAHGVRAVCVVTDDVVVLDFERGERICDQEKLSLYRFDVGSN